MNTDPKNPHTTRQAAEAAEKFSPPVTRWSPPPPRLKGVRFKGPVAKITTVDSPLRPPRNP